MSLYIFALFLLCVINIKANNNFSDWIYDILYYTEYHVYSRGKASTPDILNYKDESALNKSTYKRRHGTIVFIHGWLDSIHNTRTQGILNAYLQFMDYNVILVDWSVISTFSYPLLFAKCITTTGKHIGKMIKWLEQHNRLNISDLHIIGMNLGAQIAGFVSKELKPQKVRRITGLDPSLPLLRNIVIQNSLDKYDADFVDIIHTSYLGVSSPYGHADFYPNYGRDQTNCWIPNLICSHERAIWYFIESISNPHKYAAYKCQYNNDQLENCDQNTTSAFMGHHANSQNHGTFLVVNTDISEPPERFNDYAI